MEKKNYHHGNLRVALIEAGITIINQEGLSQLSLRKVAALCNVSYAAPYSHFKDKDDLLSAIRDYITNKFMLIFDDVLKNNNRDNPNILGKFGEAYILFFIDNPQYFSFLFYKCNTIINLLLDDNKKDSFPPFQLFKDLAVDILRTHGMNEERVQDEIISMWVTVHGLASIATMKGVAYNHDWKDKINDILKIQHGVIHGTN